MSSGFIKSKKGEHLQGKWENKRSRFVFPGIILFAQCFVWSRCYCASQQKSCSTCKRMNRLYHWPNEPHPTDELHLVTKVYKNTSRSSLVRYSTHTKQDASLDCTPQMQSGKNKHQSWRGWMRHKIVILARLPEIDVTVWFFCSIRCPWFKCQVCLKLDTLIPPSIFSVHQENKHSPGSCTENQETSRFYWAQKCFDEVLKDSHLYQLELALI